MDDFVVVHSNRDDNHKIGFFHNSPAFLKPLKTSRVSSLHPYRIIHPHLNRLYDVIEGKYIVQELCDCSLQDLITGTKKGDPSLGNSHLWSLAFQMALGLRALHSRGLTHRRLNPNNVMINLTSFHVKLTDYFYEDPTDPPLCYSAPELLKKSFVYESDIYAIGCILLFAATGNEPWANLSSSNIASSVVSGEKVIPELYPPWLSNIVGLCLRYEAEERPSIYDFIDFLLANPPEEILGRLPVLPWDSWMSTIPFQSLNLTPGPTDSLKAYTVEIPDDPKELLSKSDIHEVTSAVAVLLEQMNCPRRKITKMQVFSSSERDKEFVQNWKQLETDDGYSSDWRSSTFERWDGRLCNQNEVEIGQRKELYMRFRSLPTAIQLAPFSAVGVIPTLFRCKSQKEAEKICREGFQIGSISGEAGQGFYTSVDARNLFIDREENDDTVLILSYVFVSKVYPVTEIDPGNPLMSLRGKPRTLGNDSHFCLMKGDRLTLESDGFPVIISFEPEQILPVAIIELAAQEANEQWNLLISGGIQGPILKDKFIKTSCALVHLRNVNSWLEGLETDLSDLKPLEEFADVFYPIARNFVPNVFESSLCADGVQTILKKLFRSELCRDNPGVFRACLKTLATFCFSHVSVALLNDEAIVEIMRLISRPMVDDVFSRTAGMDILYSRARVGGLGPKTIESIARFAESVLVDSFEPLVISAACRVITETFPPPHEPAEQPKIDKWAQRIGSSLRLKLRKTISQRESQFECLSLLALLTKENEKTAQWAVQKATMNFVWRRLDQHFTRDAYVLSACFQVLAGVASHQSVRKKQPMHLINGLNVFPIIAKLLDPVNIDKEEGAFPDVSFRNLIEAICNFCKYVKTENVDMVLHVLDKLLQVASTYVLAPRILEAAFAALANLQTLDDPLDLDHEMLERFNRLLAVASTQSANTDLQVNAAILLRCSCLSANNACFIAEKYGIEHACWEIIHYLDNDVIQANCYSALRLMTVENNDMILDQLADCGALLYAPDRLGTFKSSFRVVSSVLLFLLRLASFRKIVISPQLINAISEVVSLWSGNPRGPSVVVAGIRLMTLGNSGDLLPYLDIVVTIFEGTTKVDREVRSAAVGYFNKVLPLHQVGTARMVKAVGKFSFNDIGVSMEKLAKFYENIAKNDPEALELCCSCCREHFGVILKSDKHCRPLFKLFQAVAQRNSETPLVKLLPGMLECLSKVHSATTVYEGVEVFKLVLSDDEIRMGLKKKLKKKIALFCNECLKRTSDQRVLSVCRETISLLEGEESEISFLNEGDLTEELDEAGEVEELSRTGEVERTDSDVEEENDPDFAEELDKTAQIELVLPKESIDAQDDEVKDPIVNKELYETSEVEELASTGESIGTKVEDEVDAEFTEESDKEPLVLATESIDIKVEKDPMFTEELDKSGGEQLATTGESIKCVVDVADDVTRDVADDVARDVAHDVADEDEKRGIKVENNYSKEIIDDKVEEEEGSEFTEELEREPYVLETEIIDNKVEEEEGPEFTEELDKEPLVLETEITDNKVEEGPEFTEELDKEPVVLETEIIDNKVEEEEGPEFIEELDKEPVILETEIIDNKVEEEQGPEFTEELDKEPVVLETEIIDNKVEENDLEFIGEMDKSGDVEQLVLARESTDPNVEDEIDPEFTEELAEGSPEFTMLTDETESDTKENSEGPEVLVPA